MRPRRSYGALLKGSLRLRWSSASAGLLAGSGRGWSQPTVRCAPATEVARDAAASRRRPKKIQERVEPGSQQAATTPGAAARRAAVAQKVVLYEEDPGDPNGKRFVGSAIWRTETVSPGPGQPPELAIRADVEVPERKLAMTWLLRRNTDKGLPASHTVEIMFRLPAGFPVRRHHQCARHPDEAGRADPRRAARRARGEGDQRLFLIGLSNLDTDKERNVQLLKERAWFDIPVVYNNNRRAILAMERARPASACSPTPSRPGSSRPGDRCGAAVAISTNPC